MKRIVIQVILVLCLLSVLVGGYFLFRHALSLPFRATNDTLHEEGYPVTLDFLIPAGTHLDEKITIGEVIKVRFSKQQHFSEKTLRFLSEQIPDAYRYLADLFLFLFWTFLYMTFLRVFTFLGYARALRASLFLGGTTYYFMPDFSPGKGDDVLFVALSIGIILLRFFIRRRKKRSRQAAA